MVDSIFNIDKKIHLRLEGLDGNAFALLGAFDAQAKAEGWTDEERALVLDEAMSGDYWHLITILFSYCNQE